MFPVPWNFGPLIDLWEGKNQGEGIVKYIKSALIMGLRKGWQKRPLEKLLVRKGMGAMMMNFDGKRHGAYLPDDHNDDDDNDFNVGGNPHNNSQPDQSLHYHSYDTIYDVHSAIEGGKPLSCVILEEEGHNNNTNRCIASIVGKDEYLELCFIGPNHKIVNGMVYKDLQRANFNDGTGYFLPQQVVASLLLLPILVEVDIQNNEKYYTAINSRWEFLQPDRRNDDYSVDKLVFGVPEQFS